jgi:hypothetical protein
MRNANQVVWAAVCGALLGCSGDAPRGAAFEVSDSSGVVIARNHRPPADTIRLVEPRVEIGMVEGPAEYLFELISDVQPLPGGSVVVVDNRGARVALYGADGRWVRDVGGRGDGPGEYRTPLRAWLEEGELHVHDVVPRRLLRFTPGGEFRGGEPAVVGFRGVPAPLRGEGSGWVDEREWGHAPQPGPAMGALVRVSDAGEVTDTLVGPYPIPRIGWETDATGMGRMVNPPVFSPAPQWTMGEELLFWSPGDVPRIEARLGDGSLSRIISLPGADAPVDAADRHTWREAVHARYGVPLAALEGEDFAPRRPAVTGLLADDRGRLWVAAHDAGVLRGEPGRSWTVLDGEGRQQRQVEFPAGFRLLRVAGGRAYGVASGEAGVETVAIFDLPGD